MTSPFQNSPSMVLRCRRPLPAPRKEPRPFSRLYLSVHCCFQAQLALKCGCTCNMPPHRERTPALG